MHKESEREREREGGGGGGGGGEFTQGCFPKQARPSYSLVPLSTVSDEDGVRRVRAFAAHPLCGERRTRSTAVFVARSIVG